MNSLDRLALEVATLGPLGRLPKAPGTWGSAAAVLAAPWLFLPLPTNGRLLLLALILGLGIWASTRAEAILGRTDPGCVVVDELLGQWATLLPLTAPTPLPLLLGFALFRLLDILKPWPIRAVERSLPGGLGIMADDLLAGLIAGALLAFGLPLLP
ncbi:phosphatidylglycerophosphatase A [Desulfovibrio aminophilus]|uniref:phosphatidylglycerophosphatase A family protein n=1 Tax=Desulfovibrio aminophilus TaxID=81425 RepID=UPI003393CFDE